MAKYNYWVSEEGLIRLQGYARDGLTDLEIAKKIHVSRSTLNLWRKKFKRIDEVLKEQKEIVDRKVEISLFDRATGMKVTLKKPFKVKRIEYDEKTGKKILEEEEIVYADLEEYIPPDTKAITFWLTNRKPEDWRQRIEVETKEEKEESGVIQIGSVMETNVIDAEYIEADNKDPDADTQKEGGSDG